MAPSLRDCLVWNALTYIFDETTGLDHSVVAGDIGPGKIALLGVSLILLVLVDFDLLGIELDFVDLEECVRGCWKNFRRVAFARVRGLADMSRVILTWKALKEPHPTEKIEKAKMIK
jgi:hypothetical protein